MSRFLLAACLVFFHCPADAQTSPSLVGTWRLVSYVRSDSLGAVQPYWDDRPSGLIIYTADGHVAAQLYDSRRPRVGDAWERATPDAARTAFVGLVTYFGTYALDPAARTVTHSVEGAMAPDWIGSKLVRAYRFLGPNVVELRVTTDASGQRVVNGAALVWERVR